MLNFLLILFFSKTVLLTPDYIDVDSTADGYTFILQEPINAITQGASIQIDVTKMLDPFSKGDLFKVRSAISDLFKSGSIEVTLGEGDEAVRLEYKGSTLISNDRVSLALVGDNIPTGIDFTKLVLKTEVKLERIKIYWKNYKK
ncbi:hypothetical protein [Zooshikella harenae]|uniref:Uncharacterized protein n=1 Tax=Zooshikella harenae TaxID=2827238 RepID=A0ABS5ZL92_9GAMM|nr:hypothetical protein [Zooshikella harenae]MBU2714151.1 hypothetical protein [Zooshikella harenae]